ncbi:hypothetical protein IV203_016241 [Nitzschia inconspicua]|uniref:Plastid lipid-associated protein/fibrillin conserved domain-containing protein n=1 Tax=Nitzschia inconspicua TaxID=303405 RepID=A0A9K3KQ89_9STRA|nr:hypothetical protein IV203_017456 [Nitzschia inconspicua]KAG7347536.1 hypothetical protein IV203_016241 [Nitzschia inconspicua]
MRNLSRLVVLAALIARGALGLSSSSHREHPQQHKAQQQFQYDTHSSSPCSTTGTHLSRRSCLTAALGGFLTGTVALTLGDEQNRAVFAVDDDSNPIDDIYRSQLLNLIDSNKATEGDILTAIEKLVPYDPSKKAAATLEDELDGEWKLLWSAKAEAFSPLLKLPPPLKPISYQYLGKTAAGEVGSGRIAQGLTGGVLCMSQLWLSSGSKVAPDDPSILEIFPPFRLELGGRYQSGTSKKLLVEAGSDAEFRKLNARTAEAQAAPKNRYQQLYLERNGKGSLRISTIADGDPAIVGAIFVHEKL